jgi:IclR family mhp operon transcriptional activator
MAFCSDGEREHLLEGLRTIEGAAEKMATLLLSNDSLLREVRNQGYATQSRNAYTANPGKTSSIAVPIIRGEEVAGAITIIFFSVAMPMEKAISQFVAPVTETARAISRELSAL